MKLARDPLRADCLERGVTEPATQVHHSVPARERPDLAFVMEVLVSRAPRVTRGGRWRIPVASNR